MGTGIILVTSTAGFLVLHTIVEPLTRAPFEVAFRLTRGVASVLLTFIGFFMLFYAYSLWPEAWVIQQRDGVAAACITFALGHFVADFFLLAWGRLWHGEPARLDLIAHHALGMVGGSLALYLRVAQELFVLMYTAELMPVTTAMSAIGALRANKALERLGAQLRLVTLLGWRMPMWAVIGVLTVYNLLSGPDPLRATALWLTLLFLSVLITLDVTWIRKSFRALRRMT